MARLVKHDRSEPYKVEQGDQTIWICGCGLSKNKPFCDGSHKSSGFQSEVKARQLPPPAPKPQT